MSKIEKKITRLGFTLIEIVIAVVTVAILASLVMPRFLSQRETARAAEAVNVMGAIRRAELQYLFANNTFYPPTGIGDRTFVFCGDSNVPDVLGIDLAQSCVNWTFQVQFNREAPTQLLITAFRSTNIGTLSLTAPVNGESTWSGTGVYDPATGQNWPHLN